MKIDSFNIVFNISTIPFENVKSNFAGSVYFAIRAVILQAERCRKKQHCSGCQEGMSFAVPHGLRQAGSRLCGEKECIDVTSKSESGTEQLPAESEPTAEPMPKSAAELPQSESEPEPDTESEPAEQSTAESLVK